MELFTLLCIQVFEDRRLSTQFINTGFLNSGPSFEDSEYVKKNIRKQLVNIFKFAHPRCIRDSHGGSIVHNFMDVEFVTIDGKLSVGKESLRNLICFYFILKQQFSLVSIGVPQADIYLACNPRGWELWGSRGQSETLSKLTEQTRCLQLRTENIPCKA